MATKRVNISIPSELAEDLKEHKGTIVVSEVCARALREEIRMRTAVREARSGLQETIARIRAGKRAYDDEVKANGFQTGVEWARVHIEYDTFKWFETEASDTWEDAMRRDQRELLELVLYEEGNARDDPFDPSEAWWNGFGEGVLDIWGQVKDDVER
ncbi:hypothetical protein ACFL59_10290 [Planctomycetota bacterium]